MIDIPVDSLYLWGINMYVFWLGEQQYHDLTAFHLEAYQNHQIEH